MVVMVDVEVTIVLVEDDPGHARLVELNLRRSGIKNEIVVMPDGQRAIDYLFGENGFHDPPDSPMLVLLDLNLPVLDGYQVLQRIKGDERTKHIPVVVLTT